VSRFLAIDFDAGGLLVASGHTRGDAARLENAAASFDDPRPLSAAHAEEAGDRLKALLAQAGIAPAPALVALGRDRVIFKEVKHPKTAPADEPAIVRFQAQRDLTESPDDVHMDYVPVPTGEGEENRATVVFVRKDLYEAAKTACERAGLKLAGVTPRPFAAVAAARAAAATNAVPPPDDPNGAVAVLSLWEGGGEFVVADHQRLAYSRSVSAAALGSEAALVGEVKRSLAAYTAAHPKHPLQAIYLAEGHAGGGSWAARLDATLPVSVYPFDPLGGLAADGVPAALRGRFVGPVGLLAARGHALPINFVTPRQPRAEPNKVRSRGLLGLVALLVLGGGAFAGSKVMHNSLDDKIKGLNARKAAVQADLKAQQADTARIAAADEYRERSVVWLDELYNVAVMNPDPDKMRLKEFEAKIPEPKVEQRKPGQAAPPAGSPVAAAGLPGAKPPAAGVKPAVAAKPAEKKPAGTLKLVYVSPNSTLPDKLKELFIQDEKGYQKPVLQFGATSGGNQEFTITAEVMKKPPTEYTRRLTAKFPEAPKLPPPVDPDAEGENNQ
jgi:Tfp pilus assembly PilM family ATPase